jgi:hypothetical protein
MALDLRSQRQPCTGAHSTCRWRKLRTGLSATGPPTGRCSVLGAESIPRWGFTWHFRPAAELSICLAQPVAAGKGTGDFGKFNERASCFGFIGCDCGHLGRSADLVARLLVKSGLCRIRFWYSVAPGSGISREISRIYFWNLTVVADDFQKQMRMTRSCENALAHSELFAYAALMAMRMVLLG